MLLIWAHRYKAALFCFGAITPGPEFRGNLRERGPRSPATGFQRFDPPLGAHASPRRSGKADQGSRGCQPQGCASAGRRAAHGGAVSAAGGATFGRSGGARRKKRAQTGQKAAHAGVFGLPGLGAHRVSRRQPGLLYGARREKVGRRRGKTGRSGVLRGRVRRALGAKSPLLPRKGRAKGCGGAKTGGESWRGV